MLFALRSGHRSTGARRSHASRSIVRRRFRAALDRDLTSMRSIAT
jgi:hypothetical protein